ncbi:MAG TPA: 30S ribosomal protein S27e [Candidatus Thalassarchaeaceae archaeon]|jgi:small subunit ribosomal protein S27e|nr:30S ribosomal protein S27e [Candidatus Thalassarchaeaceae archaeon]
MTGRFLKVSCRDCGNESTIFDRASTTIACSICGSTLAEPSGGMANLTGCTVVEELN